MKPLFTTCFFCVSGQNRKVLTRMTLSGLGSETGQCQRQVRVRDRSVSETGQCPVSDWDSRLKYITQGEHGVSAVYSPYILTHLLLGCYGDTYSPRVPDKSTASKISSNACGQTLHVEQRINTRWKYLMVNDVIWRKLRMFAMKRTVFGKKKSEQRKYLKLQGIILTLVSDQGEESEQKWTLSWPCHGGLIGRSSLWWFLHLMSTVNPT